MRDSGHERKWAAFGRALIGLAGLVLSLGNGAAADRESEWRDVQDPHFGEVLYYFFQEKYFSAITHLMASRHFDRFPHHDDEAQLLLGGLNLSYGLHVEAGRIFERLADTAAAPAVRDRAWYYLAKIRYQRGYLAEAEDAVGRIRARLPGDLEDQRHLLYAQLLMRRGDYARAAEMLRSLPGKSAWAAYGRYNLGVALIKSGEIQTGVELLEEVGRQPATTEEMKSLRDKANVALGFAFIQQQVPIRAQSYLQRVRLDGLLSNKALLGAGWAFSAQERQEQALVPWMELQGRSVMDSAVQEALLAVPYALGRLGAYRQSLAHYEQAMAVYARETAQLDLSIAAIRAGHLVRNILRENTGTEAGWFWRIDRLPDSPESHYLFHLLATHEFQEALKNYRDMRFLLQNLAQWSESIAVYGDMLATRRQAYGERLPQVLQQERRLDLQRLHQERDRYATELARVEAEADAAALANERERELLQRLGRVHNGLARMPESGEAMATRDRYRLLRGLLLWDLSTEFHPRLWETKKSMAEIDETLAEATRRREALARAQFEAPRQFEGYGERIRQLRRRLAELQAQVAAVTAEQERFVTALAVAELERQKERLATYMTQARFAVAQIYDQAASRQGAGP